MGVSIGLGNVWRFPYMMGQYGGSAFLFIYLIFTLFLAIPALMAELTMGRISGRGTIDAFRKGFGSKVGVLLGYFFILVITISGSYYVVVVSNVLFTSIFSVFNGFSPSTLSDYRILLANGWITFGFSLALIIFSLYIIHQGLVGGIERISKRVMPLFFLALVYMIVHALSLPDALEKCGEFLRADFGSLHFPEVFAAMGQAFFSVGLGGTFVVVYGGFLRKTDKIPSVALYTGLGDASASLLVSLFLVPAILALGMSLDSGPGLIFETLPQLFNIMPGGRIVGSLFLISLFIVAFLSLIAAYQVPFTTVQNEFPLIDQRKILVTIGIVQALLALPISMNPDLIGFLDLIFGSGMQVLGSVLIVLGLTYGIRRMPAMREMFVSNSSSRIALVLYFLIKWIIPITLLAVLVGYIIDVTQ
ncbi:MAG: sodium-dependent transporter [Flammeovirgaceae bacterium]|nr:sodium-dependent transporter [Flammeovirgaceae bacterium]